MNASGALTVIDDYLEALLDDGGDIGRQHEDAAIAAIADRDALATAAPTPAWHLASPQLAEALPVATTTDATIDAPNKRDGRVDAGLDAAIAGDVERSAFDSAAVDSATFDSAVDNASADANAASALDVAAIASQAPAADAAMTSTPAPASSPAWVPDLHPDTASPARVAMPPQTGATPAVAAHGQRWLRAVVGRDSYALELLCVQEVVRVAPIVAMRGAACAVLGVMNLRGRIVPVFDLGLWLGTHGVDADDRSRIVVIERNDELIGVLVSAVEDVVTLGRDRIEPPLPGNHPGPMLGIARVGATPTVLLDANALFG